MAAPGVRGQDAREKWKKTIFVFKDPEAAFGTESATRGGSFWTRIRWGKAVVAPGVRGQDAREKWKKTVQKRRLAPKVRQGRLVWDQN